MFIAMLSPQGDAFNEYDNTISHTQQKNVYPQILHDFMSVREEVSSQSGIPLEAVFDKDDARSWHWVIYASVASTSSPSPPSLRPIGSSSKTEEQRRSSASAQSLAVGTIRLVPPPHGPNKYTNHGNHPAEPYVKLSRLSVLKEYRGLKLSNQLIDAAMNFAAHNPDTIRPPPAPTTLEFVHILGKGEQEATVWEGLAMVHSPLKDSGVWKKYGFAEALVDEKDNIEIAAEAHWNEEGVTHLALWKRMKIDAGRL